MVGGTVADLFHADERGLAMNVFSFMIFLGQVSTAHHLIPTVLIASYRRLEAS